MALTLIALSLMLLSVKQLYNVTHNRPFYGVRLPSNHNSSYP